MDLSGSHLREAFHVDPEKLSERAGGYVLSFAIAKSLSAQWWGTHTSSPV